VTPIVYQGEALTVDLGLFQETVAVATASGTDSTGQRYSSIHMPRAHRCLHWRIRHRNRPARDSLWWRRLRFHHHSVEAVRDINGDGNMVYVEYDCTQGTLAAPGNLYRNQMSVTAGAKPAVDNTMILLNNVLQNPNDPNNNPVPCFAYQIQTLGSGLCVTDVAVTLTCKLRIRIRKPVNFNGRLRLC